MLTGKQFFPHLISGPFHHGLVIVFSMAIAVLVIAAAASLMRGGRYVHDEAAATGAQPAANGAAAGGTAPLQARPPRLRAPMTAGRQARTDAKTRCAPAGAATQKKPDPRGNPS